MEKIYTLLFILFVLSQISERIANFFKLKLSDTRLLYEGNKKRFWKFFSFRNTKVRADNPEEEKDREFRILKINIVTGILIAFSFRTDFFCIIRHIDAPTAHIGWSTLRADLSQYVGGIDKYGLRTTAFYFSVVLGCIITGILLSFGSKFWHDAIDLILQVKDYKKMLTRQGIAEQKNNFSTLEYDQQESILDAAINEQYDAWKARYPNIVGCSSGLKKTDNQEIPQKAIVFKVDGKGQYNNQALAPSDIIPEEIHYRGYVIPTDVIDYRRPYALIKFPGEDEIPSLLGYNVSLSGYWGYGTAGLKVRKGDQDYLLSCFHVLCINRLKEHPDTSKTLTYHNTVDTPPYRISIPSALYNSEHNEDPSLKGYFTDGVLSGMVDVAIARITDGALVNHTFDDKGKSLAINGEFPYNKLYKGMRVETYGCVSGRQTGTIVDVRAQKSDVWIMGDGYSYLYTFTDLIELDCPCQDGDSGAPALSEAGEIIGIVSAGNLKRTLIVPFSSIKKALSITL